MGAAVNPKERVLKCEIHFIGSPRYASPIVRGGAAIPLLFRERYNAVRLEAMLGLTPSRLRQAKQDMPMSWGKNAGTAKAVPAARGTNSLLRGFGGKMSNRIARHDLDHID